MAFNWQTFKTRTGTAIIFVAVMLAGLFINPWLFLLLFTIIHFGCWYEYQRLVAGFAPTYQNITPFHRYGVMLAGICFLFYFSGDTNVSDQLSLHAIGWWMGLMFLFVLPITELLFNRNIELQNIKYSALGLMYLSLSIGLLINLEWLNYLFPVLIIFSIWVNDTMAYIVGSLIGKTSLSATSPKKTWEGTLGGIILSIATMSLIAWIFNWPIDKTAAIAAIASVTGTFGDLLESKLKRLANVKDSGHIMPGHGGFLDRFDSLLLATPFVWLFVKLFVKVFV